MRTRTPLILLIVIASLLGSVVSVAAVATTTGTAHACSVAGPWAEAHPSTDLEPGQYITIVGYGFADVVWLDETLKQPADEPDPVRPALCDFDMIPMQHIEIAWHADDVHKLAVASGPDFKVEVQVPFGVRSGEARISVGGYSVPVHVGSIIEPPPPCPLALGPDGTVAHGCPEPPPCPLALGPDGTVADGCPEPWPCPLALGPDGTVADGCPEPWPCPLYLDGQTRPAPDVDVAPGFLPPCPEPCVDHAHTTQQGTTYDYKWDCPDPCSWTQANPGAPSGTSPVWCPPPEPCQVTATETTASLSRRDACPEPCQLVGGDAWSCPEPCPALGGPAEVIECPWPCPQDLDDVATTRPMCPEPCRVFAHAGAVEPRPGEPTHTIAPYCPDPCGYELHGDVVWCPTTSAPIAPTTVDAVPEPASASVGAPPQAPAAVASEASMPSLERPEPIEPQAAHGLPLPAEQSIALASPEPATASPAPVAPAPVAARPLIAFDGVVSTQAAPADVLSAQATPTPPQIASRVPDSVAAALTQRVTRSASKLVAALFG